MTGDPTVLVVGSGPVGLVLACELVQRGVTVRLVDREQRTDTDPHSRAILIWPRTLEQLERIGVASRLVAAGHRMPGVGYYSEGRLLGTVRLDRLRGTPYPFILTLPQRDTERILRQRLTELGGRIEHGVALEELDPLRPQALLRHPDGAGELINPDWVVGADGAASTVRHFLGTRFDGDPIDVTYGIADAAVIGLTEPNAQYYYSRRGVVAVIPLRDGLYRIAANIPHRQPGDGPPERRLFQQIITERAGRQVVVEEPVWASSFRPRCGIAEKFRVGRTFLAGDAAHVISPAGGHGMNTGILDAANLGWKLAGVVTGRLPEAVLDSYHPERSGAVATMSATTARQARIALQRGAVRVRARDALFVAAHRLGLVQRVLAPLMSQLGVRYAAPAGADDRVGTRVPLFTMSTVDGATLDPAGYTVLAWPGRRRPAGWQRGCAQLRALLPAGVAFRELAGRRAAGYAAMRQALGGRPALAVVRPDGYLARLSPLRRAGEVVAFLEAATRVPGPPVPAPRVPHPPADQPAHR